MKQMMDLMLKKRWMFINFDDDLDDDYNNRYNDVDSESDIDGNDQG